MCSSASGPSRRRDGAATRPRTPRASPGSGRSSSASSAPSPPPDRRDAGQLLVLAAIILAVAYVGLTMISQDLANTGFDAVREEARSLVREYDNAKSRFGVALEHLSNHGNHSDAARPDRETYLVQRAFDRLLGNYTALEASRRTHLSATLVSVTPWTGRQVNASVDLLFQDEFTKVREDVTFRYPLYLADDWWDPDGAGSLEYDYRIPVHVNTRLLDRTDYGIEVEVNLTKALERVGHGGTAVASQSIRVVEMNAEGTSNTAVTPRGVWNLTGYDATTDARVLVVWQMDGKREERTDAWFYIYFDDTAQGSPSNGTLRLLDSFERADIGPDWSPASQDTDTGQARTGTRSWRSHAGQDAVYDIESHLGLFDGLVDLWFYDPGPATTNVDAWANVTMNHTGDPTDLHVAVGLDEDVSTQNYSIYAPWLGGPSDTHFPRSEGWHRITVSMNETDLNVYLDQKRLTLNETLAPYQFRTLTITHASGHADTWWDDVAISEDVIVSRVHPVDMVVRWPQRAESA